MAEPVTIERVQALRRLTRAVTDVLRDQLLAYLSTLGVLFRPSRVLGQFIHGSEKEPAKGADRAFRDLQALYENVARARPFTLTRELRSPIELSSVALEVHAVEYRHQLQVPGESRIVVVRSPLKWTVTYAGQSPATLPELLARRTGANEELYSWLVHQLVLHSVVSNQPGLAEILERLHFPIASVTEAASGAVPLTRVSSPLSTIRPPDDVILQSVELSGMDAFEEVINVSDIPQIGDPLKERLMELAMKHGEMPLAR
jgi:hypothetical protein